MPAPFRTERSIVPEMGTFILQVFGTITFEEAPELREAIFSTLKEKGNRPLVVELAGVERMDTAGVAALLEGLIESRRQNRPYFLCGPSDSVLRIFRLAGLPDALESCCRGPEEVQEKLGRSDSRS